MRSCSLALAALAASASVSAANLEDVCNAAYAKSALPQSESFQGITIDRSSVTTAVVYNISVTGEVYYPDSTISYCNVTFAYTHDGLDDLVHLQYWLPAPSKFENRYLSTGGFGYAINEYSTFLPGGIIYGAVSGATDGGFGSFDTNFDAVFPLSNGTENWDALYMFAYKGIHEQTLIGKEYAKRFYNVSNKIYSYYQGCSEGGREGWSQVQRFADQWDGAVTGAPAIRFGLQQVNHLLGNIVQQTVGYYPPYCELEKIVNLTISACDGLDGRVDGVIGRSDLCLLTFDMNSTIGEPYSCSASTGSSEALKKRQIISSGSSPAQDGTVTAKGVEVATCFYNGLFDSEGKRVYLPWALGSQMSDAETEYDYTTGEWGLDINSFGTEFVQRFLNLLDTDDMYTLDNVTYDTLKEWMHTGWQKYSDSLHTTWPDLTPFQSAGGKVIHFHGESDNSDKKEA